MKKAIRMKKVAIFDIDGTIFRSSLLIELADALIQEGVFPAQARRSYVNFYRKWLDRQGPYEEYIDAVVKAFRQNIKGVEYGEFSRVARKVVAFHKNRVYRYTRDLVDKLKKKNYYLLAISHSPQRLVKEFCRRFGFDKTYGMIYETDGGRRFTGQVLHAELIHDKAKILRRALAKECLTLTDSVGVGDSESDIPFLKMVKKPICFNPNRQLYNYAKAAGWQIIVERKDVVYRFNKMCRASI